MCVNTIYSFFFGVFSGGLTLPYPPVLQDLIGDEDHVVAVSFGRLEATSAHTEDLLDSYATEADTVQFFIPFLTGKDETAEPMYKLALNSFVSTDKPFFQPNVAIPTEQVESISLSDTGLVVRNGSDVLSISLTVPSSKSCVVPDIVTEEKIEGYNREYTLSHLVKPNQALCNEGSTADLHVCVVRELPCMCQFWYHRKLQECDVGETLLDTISDKFKEISLLSGDEGAAVVSVANTGDFGIVVKSPCV